MTARLIAHTVPVSHDASSTANAARIPRVRSGFDSGDTVVVHRTQRDIINHLKINGGKEKVSEFNDVENARALRLQIRGILSRDAPGYVKFSDAPKDETYWILT